MITLGDDLAAIVLGHAERSAGSAAEGIYADVDAVLGESAQMCTKCGRCCQFETFGHRLYVSTIELVYFVTGLRGRWPAPTQLPGRDPLPAGHTQACPFQIAGFCTIRPLRPAGCRLFFCRPDDAERLSMLHEDVHRRLAQASETLTPPYAYVEWLSALEVLGKHMNA